MARSDPVSSLGPEVSSINLSRIISRLERTLLSSDANPELRKSRYERARVGANLEHARLLLLRLEHDTATTHGGQSKKHNVQADLKAKRDLIKQLNQRLTELNQLDDDDGNSSDESTDDSAASSDDEREDAAAFPSYAPARADASAGLDRELDTRESRMEAGAAALTSTLRSRRTQGTATGQAPSTGTTSGSSLLPAGASKAPASDAPPLQQTEKMLTHNRTEQEDLSNSLLSMAQALKAQSMQFGESLESEKSVLGRAAEGLDKNALGMEAASRRMQTLRRMSEGWGAFMKKFGYWGAWGFLFILLLVEWALLPKMRLNWFSW